MLDIITREALWRADLARIITEIDETDQPPRRDSKVTRRRVRKPAPWWEE